MTWVMVQLGDKDQCINNDVQGWEYRIGLNTGNLRHEAYIFHNSSDTNTLWTNYWSVRPHDSTNFRLELIKE